MLDNVQKTHYIEFLVTLRDTLLRGKNERSTKIFLVLKKCRRFENSHLNCVQKVHLPFKQGFQHVQKAEIMGPPPRPSVAGFQGTGSPLCGLDRLSMISMKNKKNWKKTFLKTFFFEIKILKFPEFSKKTIFSDSEFSKK